MRVFNHFQFGIKFKLGREHLFPVHKYIPKNSKLNNFLLFLKMAKQSGNKSWNYQGI